mgnify:CR=1 FL=1
MPKEKGLDVCETRTQAFFCGLNNFILEMLVGAWFVLRAGSRTSRT